MFSRVWIGFVSGAVIGIAIVVGLMATDTRVHDTDDALAVAQPSAKAATTFVDAWKTMRTGTWTLDETFVRTAGAGRSFTGQIHEAQRPPQRVRAAFGTKTIELPGKTVVCAADTGNAKGACRSENTDITYDESVQSDVDGLQKLVIGDYSPYSVAASSRHCFVVQAKGTLVSPTWGRKATFCFDASTGALQSSEIVRGEATDSTSATSIRSSVLDSEFVQSEA
jgi:hypothetical protein